MAKSARSRLQGEPIGRNVTVAIEGDTIVVRMSASAEGTDSKSGKSTVIATTNGNVRVPGTDMNIGLNLYRPN